MSKARNNSAKPYVGKLQRVKELVSESQRLEGNIRGLWHERTALLVELFNDAEYRIKVEVEQNKGPIDDPHMADALNRFTEDMGYEFYQLQRILEVFPKRQQWIDGSLPEMFDQARRVRPGENGEQRQAARPRLTRAEHDKVCESSRHAEARVRFVQTELDRAKARIAELVSELDTAHTRNAELKSNLDRAKARIAELETKRAAVPA